ncbi:type I glutamate--ammonia ligase [Streptomyces chartreusis]|uniref:hypothetical protein n=1 Tax=Streptomyces chartreusis TaxID=1969 RepID=UPI003825EA57
MHHHDEQYDERPTGLGPWHTGALSPAGLRELVQSGEITAVRLAVPDMQGRAKGKILAAPVFVDRMNSQAEMCAYVLATDVDMTPLDGFALTGWEQGYGDLGVKADLGSIRGLPHQPGTTLIMGDVFHHDGQPVDVAPATCCAPSRSDWPIPATTWQWARRSNSSSTRAPTRMRT